MRKNHLLIVALNFSAVVILIALIATPIYFARNFAKVAGVKSESKYLIVSQIEKFPNMTFSQNGDNYQISFNKLGPSQAFLGILIVNNPTNSTQTYKVEVTDGQAELFFGEDIGQREDQISLPSTASVPVSVYSGEEATAASQTVGFGIITTAVGE